MTLSSKDAILIALDGSKQYRQKNASLVGDQRMPDPVLNSHRLLAEQMIGLAKDLRGSDAGNPYAVPLTKAAAIVLQGYPAKEACYAVAKTEDEAIKLASVTEDVAMDLLAIAAVAEYKAKKKI
jgi:isocitrate dehydrogenase